jgi:hypothetical protein
MPRSETDNGTPIADETLHATAAEIARTRERLAASLGALRHELDALTDWREWIARRPLQFLAGAFALGLIAGSRR